MRCYKPVGNFLLTSLGRRVTYLFTFRREVTVLIPVGVRVPLISFALGRTTFKLMWTSKLWAVPSWDELRVGRLPGCRHEDSQPTTVT
jgi:hypothetical protein